LFSHYEKLSTFAQLTTCKAKHHAADNHLNNSSNSSRYPLSGAGGVVGFTVMQLTYSKSKHHAAYDQLDEVVRSGSQDSTSHKTDACHQHCPLPPIIPAMHSMAWVDCNNSGASISVRKACYSMSEHRLCTVLSQCCACHKHRLFTVVKVLQDANRQARTEAASKLPR
jgi:hypothetical protein